MFQGGGGYFKKGDVLAIKLTFDRTSRSTKGTSYVEI